MSRGVSTVVDVVIALSLVSAAAVVLATATPPTAAAGRPVPAADAVGSTLLSTTLTVSYQANGDRRTVRGPAGALLADAALAAEPSSSKTTAAWSSTPRSWWAGRTAWYVRQARRFWRPTSYGREDDTPAARSSGPTDAEAAYVAATQRELNRTLHAFGRGVAVAAVAPGGRTVRAGSTPPPRTRVELASYRLPAEADRTVTLYVRTWSA